MGGQGLDKKRGQKMVDISFMFQESRLFTLMQESINLLYSNSSDYGNVTINTTEFCLVSFIVPCEKLQL